MGYGIFGQVRNRVGENCRFWSQDRVRVFRKRTTHPHPNVLGVPPRGLTPSRNLDHFDHLDHFSPLPFPVLFASRSISCPGKSKNRLYLVFHPSRT